MTLVYCAKAAQAEIARTDSARKWFVLHKPTLGLVPVVDGKCPFCHRDIKTTA